MGPDNLLTNLRFIIFLAAQSTVVLPNAMLYRPKVIEFAIGRTSISCFAVAATTGELTALSPAQKVALLNWSD